MIEAKTSGTRATFLAPYQFRLSQLLWTILPFGVAASLVAPKIRSLTAGQWQPATWHLAISLTATTLAAVGAIGYRTLVANAAGTLLLATGAGFSGFSNLRSLARAIYYRLQAFILWFLLGLCILSNPVDVAIIASRGNPSATFSTITTILMPGLIVLNLVANRWAFGPRSLEFRTGGILIRGKEFVPWSNVAAIDLDDRRAVLTIELREPGKRICPYLNLRYNLAITQAVRATADERIGHARRFETETLPEG